MITTATTEGIKISIKPKFEGFSHSSNRFVFSYQVFIENHSDDTVQLLRRHWFIHDASGKNREVEGAGVIGEQPILKPKQVHRYNSWCPLETEFGKMYGTFLMQRESDKSQFKVIIPVFKMAVPYRLS